jgi:hypothetical protein
MIGQYSEDFKATAVRLSELNFERFIVFDSFVEDLESPI